MTTDMMMGERDIEAELKEKDEIIMSLRLNEHLLKDKLEISRRNMSKQLERINALEKENEELKQQLKTKRVVNRQYEEKERLKKENNKLKKQVEDCNDYNSILYNKIIEGKHKFVDFMKKVNEQQSTINNQEQKIKILQQEINDTQAILEMLTEKLKGWNDE